MLVGRGVTGDCRFCLSHLCRKHVEVVKLSMHEGRVLPCVQLQPCLAAFLHCRTGFCRIGIGLRMSSWGRSVACRHVVLGVVLGNCVAGCSKRLFGHMQGPGYHVCMTVHAMPVQVCLVLDQDRWQPNCSASLELLILLLCYCLLVPSSCWLTTVAKQLAAASNCSHI
jgi:hypothetical protein